jgi:hypothetical protein
MQATRVICAIEHVLRDDGCNEVVTSEVFARVKSTRGNQGLGAEEFLSVLGRLITDGLFEQIGESDELTLDSLVARSQMHPSVPVGGIIQL